MKTQTKWIVGGAVAVLAGVAVAYSLSGTKAAPAPTTPGMPGGYTVQQGDTLGAIARRFGTTVAALVAANNIANPDVIRVGQHLALPG